MKLIRIRVARNEPKSWKISNKNQQKSLEYHKFFFKTIKLMFTDINIYSINNKTDHIRRNIFLIEKKSWYFPDFMSDLEQDPDPLFHETDPRIRIHIKMKRIRNTFFLSKMLWFKIYTVLFKTKINKQWGNFLSKKIWLTEIINIFFFLFPQRGCREQNREAAATPTECPSYRHKPEVS